MRTAIISWNTSRKYFSNESVCKITEIRTNIWDAHLINVDNVWPTKYIYIVYYLNIDQIFIVWKIRKARFTCQCITCQACFNLEVERTTKTLIMNSCAQRMMRLKATEYNALFYASLKWEISSAKCDLLLPSLLIQFRFFVRVCVTLNRTIDGTKCFGIITWMS